MRVIRIWRLVNSSNSAPVQGCTVAARHSGQKTMGFPADSSAYVSAKSSLTEPFHASSTFTSSNVLRRMAVPPPQQKFPLGLPSIVTTAPFQADAKQLASDSIPDPLGIIQR